MAADSPPMDTPTLDQLIAAFNQRLAALEAVDTGQVTEGFDAGWNGWPLIEMRVRPEWRGSDTHDEVRDGMWNNGEAAWPTVEWETITNEAIYWDDYEDFHVTPGSFGFQRFAVDPARIDQVLALVEKVPVLTDEGRAGQLADHLMDI
jgi:hypothetical protein